MARYFFIVMWPDGRSRGDEEGMELSDDRGAQAYAQRIIRELREGGGYDDPGLHMIVRNEAGKQLFVIPFGIHR
jgi:hypothetical protein